MKDFRDSWEQLTQAAGVPNLLFHDLRRSAARNMLRAGISRDVAKKKITGYKTDSMFSRYNIVTEDDLMEAAEKQDRRRATQNDAGQSTAKTEISPPLAATSKQSS